MLKTLKLTNFRQHRDLTVNLSPGLNVIRGANEKGKSTVNEAIAYALYGAKALREPLEDTVTWGEKSSTLRVDLTFSMFGADGRVVRSKSGAELLHGTTTASGHAEVTKYFETLLNAKADTANALFIASQRKVLGALGVGGDSAAIGLIERLGDFDLLERIIDSIQHQRPSGSTVVLTNMIAKAAEDLEESGPAQPDLAPVQAAQEAADLAGQAYTAATANKAKLEPIAAAARATIHQADQARARAAAAARRLADIDAELAQPEPVCAVTESQLQEWRQAKADDLQWARRVAAYKTKLPSCDYAWSESLEALKVAIADNQSKLDSAKQNYHKATIDRATVQMLLINEETCSFCKKSLKDVPEVAELNSKTNSRLSEIQSNIDNLELEISERKKTQTAYEAVYRTDQAISASFSSEFWDFDTKMVPRTPIWRGEPPLLETPIEDWDHKIRKGEAAVRSWQSAVAIRNRLRADREVVEKEAQLVVEDTTVAQADLQAFEEARRQLEIARSELQAAQHRLGLEDQRYKHQAHLCKLHADKLEQARKALADLEAELKRTVFFNALIDKVRKARPVVANRLWSVVLSAVSHYATIGRGTPTTVTKDSDGFKVNGKALAAYSGSAQDVVGLAVRLALVKMFLPNISFAIMDEVAAACDDDREADLLGMVIAAEIPQVLLVTHSSIAESFANNLIEL